MNKIIRFEVDANLSVADIQAEIQLKLDIINGENGAVTTLMEDLNDSTYCYNISITYTV